MLMRRICLMALLAASITLQAQEKSKEKIFQWGVEAGLDIARMRAPEGFLSDNNRCGWFVGAKLKAGIPLPKLGVDVALLYNHNELLYDSNRQRQLHMFCVPLNLRYNHKILPRVVWYMASGPQWNWYVGNSSLPDGELRHSYFDWNAGSGFDLFGHLQVGFNYNVALGRMGRVQGTDLQSNSWNIRLAYYL